MTCHDRDLLQRVHDAGITLIVDGNRLKYTAPAGVLTPDLRAALAELKPTILHEYHERAGILEYDGRMPRPEAERQAGASTLAGEEAP